MPIDRTQVREGMTVYSSDGEKLGKVLACEGGSFIIEKGFFFPKDYVARYEDVADVTGDDVRLSRTKEAFTAHASDREWAGADAGRGELRGAATSAGEDVRMPVAEEELDVVKRDREAGQVRLRKDVVTETKQVDVPVTREEIRVERTPAGGREVAAGDRAFEEQSVSMPIREEEVEIRKRPVVKEEVRLRKERVTEQRAAEAELRKERVEIEGEGEARRAEGERDEYGSSIAPMRDDDELK